MREKLTCSRHLVGLLLLLLLFIKLKIAIQKQEKERKKQPLPHMMDTQDINKNNIKHRNRTRFQQKQIIFRTRPCKPIRQLVFFMIYMVERQVPIKFQKLLNLPNKRVIRMQLINTFVCKIHSLESDTH